MLECKAMKTRPKLTLMLLIVILLVVAYAALYNAYLHVDRCVPGGFAKDVNGEIHVYDTCYQNGIEVTRWYLDIVTGVAATSETTPQ